MAGNQHPAQRAAKQGAGHDRRTLGWQPSRVLTDRPKAERAFALAEQLGSVWENGRLALGG